MTTTSAEGIRRVIHLRQTRAIYGPERTILGLAKFQRNCGMEPIIAVIYRPFAGDPTTHPWIQRINDLELRGEILDGHPLRLRSMVRDLERLVHEDAEGTVVHCHDYKADLTALWATRRRPRPTLVTTPRHTEKEWRLRILQRIDRLFLQRFDAITVPSPAALRELDGRADLASRVHVVRHGIDEEPAPIDDSRPDPSGEPGRVVVSMIGRLHSVKRQDLLLRAAAELRHRRPDVEYRVIGEGPDRSRLERMAQRLGLNGTVRFLGYRDDVFDQLRASSVAVVASDYESSGRVVMEALQIGCPLISTPVGIVPDLVAAATPGAPPVRLFPPGDAAALAIALDELLENPEARRQLSVAGRAAIAGECDHRAAAEQMQEVYRAALRRRASRAGVARGGR